jgi:signal transduction histidine kinase
MEQPARPGSDINVRVLAGLVQYLIDNHGDEALEEVVAAADLDVDDLTSPSCWISLEQFEAIVRAARALLDSDDEFKEACCYWFEETQSPPRLLLGALSLGRAYQLAGRTGQLASTIGTFRGERLGPGHARITYESDKPETTKLVCLTRRATMEMAPTLWGLPRAQVTEPSCMAHGDAACEYDIRFYESKRWLPAVVGLLLGAVVAAILLSAGLLTPVGAAAVAVLGTALGHLVELWRTLQANLQTGQEINRELLSMALEEAEARQELAALEQRERQWSRVMEEQLQERTAVLTRVAAQIDATQHNRATTLRSFSHDLRNPLAVMRATTSLLQQSPDLAEQSARALEDVDDAVERMDSLLDELMKAATAGSGIVPLRSQRLEVSDLADSLRRRLQALVFGRPIRVSVTSTGDVPRSIVVDPLLLDRVIDNLLTNAAKYTDQGRIELELDGSDDFLSIRVTDTGRGIGADDIDRAFHPEGLPAETRAANGYGVGLSVVVQLLDQIGGRLEVMSRPNEGTTFWVHIPLTATASAHPTAGTDPSVPVPAVSEPRELFARVVTIRKAEGE